MSYYYTKILEYDFDHAIERALEELKKEGFGIISEIDVTQTLKIKLDADFRKYRILGACNPAFAFLALQAEDKIGTMLPCNVIVQEHSKGVVEVSAVDPIASMASVNNPNLMEIAMDVGNKLKRVIEGI